MFCKNCGTELDEDEYVCHQCGQAVEGNFELQREDANYAKEGKQRSESTQENNGVQLGDDAQEDVLTKARELFVDTGEREIDVLGMGALENFIRNDWNKSEYGILTNKRFYFKGKVYGVEHSVFINKTNKEVIFDLEDITFSGFSYRRNMTLFVIGILGIIASFVWMLSAPEEKMEIVFQCGWLPTLIIWLAYYFTKKAYYIVATSGGGIILNVSSHGMKRMKVFNKKLRKAKDDLKSAMIEKGSGLQ